VIAPMVTMPLDVSKRLEHAALAITKNQERMQTAFAQVGVIGLSFAQKSFNAKSRGESGGWKPLSDVTVLLRRRGSGKKIASRADLEAKKTSVQTLRDTGLAARSLAATSPDTVIEPTSMNVTFGSRVSYLAGHHAGTTSKFKFDQEMRDRFFRNVQVKTPNPRRATSTRRNLKPYVWSEYSFGLWRMLKKMDGRTYRVPARPIFEFDELTGEQMKRLIDPLVVAINEILAQK